MRYLCIAQPKAYPLAIYTVLPTLSFGQLGVGRVREQRKAKAELPILFAFPFPTKAKKLEISWENHKLTQP